MRVPPDWPYDVRRTPLFYGWVIFAMSALGMLMSIPGQTMGMAVFTEHFMDAYGLSRTSLSLAYLLGTLGSALLLTRAGRMYDARGARLMAVSASLGLALTVAALAGLDRLASGVAAFTGLPAAPLGFVLILLGYFGVRLFGQGVLTQACQNVLLAWFERRRGAVSGVRSVVVTLGFSMAPPLLAALIAALGWRGALLAMAVVVGVGFGLLALVVLRDSPEACGLRADGAPAREADAPLPPLTGVRLAVARRSPVFWVYAAALGMHALFGTALTFHVVDIFAEHGRSAGEAFGYFLPVSVVSTSVNLAASQVVDRCALKPFLVVMLVAFLVGAGGLLQLHSTAGYWLLVAGFGVGGGLWGVISNLAWVRFFGRRHLGEVSGFAISLTVFGSAVGPAMFSVGHDLGGVYAWPVGACVVLLTLLLVAALWVRQPAPVS